jgi:hypothetical protein
MISVRANQLFRSRLILKIRLANASSAFEQRINYPRSRCDRFLLAS